MSPALAGSFFTTEPPEKSGYGVGLKGLEGHIQLELSMIL